jgi:hypothetical protein
LCILARLDAKNPAMYNNYNKSIKNQNFQTKLSTHKYLQLKEFIQSIYLFLIIYLPQFNWNIVHILF